MWLASGARLRALRKNVPVLSTGTPGIADRRTRFSSAPCVSSVAATTTG